jgi:HlyD family secretion protein
MDATVRTISEDAFRKDASGNPVTNAFYRSRVALQAQTLSNMKEGSRLLPGMTLNAEIVVGKRSVISYLAWPLTKGLSEAVREP